CRPAVVGERGQQGILRAGAAAETKTRRDNVVRAVGSGWGDRLEVAAGGRVSDYGVVQMDCARVGEDAAPRARGVLGVGCVGDGSVAAHDEDAAAVPCAVGAIGDEEGRVNAVWVLQGLNET